MLTRQHEASTVVPPTRSSIASINNNSHQDSKKNLEEQEQEQEQAAAAAVAIELGQQDELRVQKQKLERSLSAPLRLKPMSHGNKSLQGEQLSINFVGNNSLFRHSCRDNGHHHHHKQTQRQQQHQHQHQQQHDKDVHRIIHIGDKTGETINSSINRHKSISPLCSSSSSASDSAFSQSQTTLGDSDESDYSKPTMTTGERRASDRLSCNEPVNGAEEEEDKYDGCLDDHFKIVWQNLSYRVQDKRLSRMVSCLSKLKEKWFSSEEGQEQEEQCPDYQLNPPLESSSRHHHHHRRLGPSQKQIEVPKLSEPVACQFVVQPHPTLMATLSTEVAIAKTISVTSTATTTSLANSTTTNRMSKQRKVIFSNLNGCVKSGQLTAILGPSGAGKTTFLKCLTNSITKGVSGSINIYGSNGSTTSQHLKLCIIPQKDYLFDNLTVMENLLFASRIKNTQTNLNHKENVHRIANLLGLHPCLKLKTSRLSGGQYKRVSIAQELLSQPDILILDEPTSGLDSLTCFRTVSVLRELADMSQSGLLPPLAIVMTIHQPQIKIFNLFHHVYILSSMGHCVYEGRPEYLIDTVADRCKLLPPPDDQNPASFIIDLASEVYGNEPINQLIELQRENFLLIHSKFIGGSNFNSTIEIVGAGDSSKFKQIAGLDCINLASDLKRSIDISAVMKPSSNYSNDIDHGTGGLYISEQLKKRNNHGHSFWLHTSLLIKRLWISMWRDSLLTTTRITFHLIIPFVFYFVYSQKSGSANACPYVERELDIQDMVSDSNIKRLATQHDELILTFENVSLFFLLLYSFSMCVLAVTALSFPLNMQILLKETTNGWYTMPRFVMAKTLADLPIELTMPMISVSIAYALTGQPSSYLSWRMLSVTAVMTLCSLISQTQGLLFGAYFMNNVQAAVFISQASTLPWIMLSGFTTRVSQLPTILQWLSFGSIYRLGIESIVSVRYGFGMCPCDEEVLKDTQPTITGIPDQLRSVMSYYMDSYAPQTTKLSPSQLGQPDNATSNGNTNQTDIFGKIASTLARANTYGADIASCNDVRPFIMTAREVNETTLPLFLSILIAVLIGLKVLLFYVVRIRAS